jgi:hypothetical protein
MRSLVAFVLVSVTGVAFAHADLQAELARMARGHCTARADRRSSAMTRRDDAALVSESVRDRLAYE